MDCDCNDGFGKLNVSVSKLKKPCEISNRTWYITIYHCSGPLLEWCGKKFIVIPAKYGMANIRVPPGCYKVGAVWSYFELPNGNYQANHFTDSALVNVGCGEVKCIKLFNPTLHTCGPIFNDAVNDTRNQLIKNATGTNNIQEINRLADAAIAGNVAFLALAREADPEVGPMFELENPAEFEQALRTRVECDSLDTM